MTSAGVGRAPLVWGQRRPHVASGNTLQIADAEVIVEEPAPCVRRVQVLEDGETGCEDGGVGGCVRTRINGEHGVVETTRCCAWPPRVRVASSRFAAPPLRSGPSLRVTRPNPLVQRVSMAESKLPAMNGPVFENTVFREVSPHILYSPNTCAFAQPPTGGQRCARENRMRRVRRADRDEGRRDEGLTSLKLDELRRVRGEVCQLCEEREIPKGLSSGLFGRPARLTTWSMRLAMGGRQGPGTQARAGARCRQVVSDERPGSGR